MYKEKHFKKKNPRAIQHAVLGGGVREEAGLLGLLGLPHGVPDRVFINNNNNNNDVYNTCTHTHIHIHTLHTCTHTHTTHMHTCTHAHMHKQFCCCWSCSPLPPSTETHKHTNTQTHKHTTQHNTQATTYHLFSPLPPALSPTTTHPTLSAPSFYPLPIFLFFHA